MRTKSNAELVSGYVAAAQAAAAGLLDFTVGSILLACGEAIGQVGLWLQGLILGLLTLTRASTSTGADLDSFYADFGFVRLGAIKANGNATFSRFTTTAAGLVPTGSSIQTADGKQVFTVRTDASNPAWNSGLGGYTLAIGVGSVTVPIRAVVAGAAGNVAPGLVNTISSSITGIDTVTNAAQITGGADVEKDAAFRARFVLYINGHSAGTRAAVDAAVAAVPGVVSHQPVENKNTDGTDHAGFFYVVIDDGTGAPSTTLVNQVTAAVAAIVPITTSFSVVKSTILAADVAFKIAPAAGFTNASMQSKAAAAVTAYMATLGLGAGLNLSRIAQVAYDASPGITNVFNITINGSAADLAGDVKKVPRGSVTVTH